MVAAVNATSVAAPSAGDRCSSPLAASAAAKSRRSSDFGGGRAKYGSASSRFSTAGIDLTGPRQGAIAVECGAGSPCHPVVQRSVARTCVERDQFPIRADPGHVRHAADVQHGERPRDIARQCGMIDRREWRALAARRDVGGAEIVRHRRCRCASPVRQRRRSARSDADRADAGSSGRGSRSGPPARPSAATART